MPFNAYMYLAKPSKQNRISYRMLAAAAVLFSPTSYITYLLKVASFAMSTAGLEY